MSEVCYYCHGDIIGKDYIYLWQPEVKQYRAIHTEHIKVNKNDTKGVITT